MQFFGFIDVNKYCLDWDFTFGHIQKRRAMTSLLSLLLSTRVDSQVFFAH